MTQIRSFPPVVHPLPMWCNVHDQLEAAATGHFRYPIAFESCSRCGTRLVKGEEFATGLCLNDWNESSTEGTDA